MDLDRFGIIYKINENEYSVGTAEKDEDGNFNLYVEDNTWKPFQTSFNKFINNSIVGYFFDIISSFKKTVEDFVKFHIEKIDIERIRIYESSDEAILNISSGEFAILKNI